MPPRIRMFSVTGWRRTSGRQLTRLEAIAARRSALGNLLSEKIAGIRGIQPHEVHPQDRAVYWFYMFRMQPKAFRCNRAEFVKAMAAEGVSGVTAGYMGCRSMASRCFRSTPSSPGTGRSASSA